MYSYIHIDAGVYFVLGVSKIACFHFRGID